MPSLQINSNVITVIISILAIAFSGLAAFVTMQNTLEEIKREVVSLHEEQAKEIAVIDKRTDALEKTAQGIIRLEVLVQVLTENVQELKVEIRQSNKRR